MTITARVIADSCTSSGSSRLTTMVLRYPRFIHAEFMTHRVFSRNASSSRAIPIQKMIDAVMDDPAMPVFWGKNQAGMQAAEELEGGARDEAIHQWLRARNSAVEHVENLMRIGLHKQISNRILEPWMHIEVVVTSSQWANFYALRDHKDAQPEMKALAEAMLWAHQNSVPGKLTPGEWHLPFVDNDTRIAALGFAQGMERMATETLCRISAARCARVSYLKHDGTSSSIEEDLQLFDRLMGGDVKHASPTEHQARVAGGVDFDGDTPNPANDFYQVDRYSSAPKNPGVGGNLGFPWVQFRKLIQGETVTEYKDFK